MTKLPRVAIYFQMYSPYILARLSAGAKYVDLIGLEGSRRSAAYAWEPIARQEGFERRTLFLDRPIETVASHEVQSALWAALEETNPDYVVVCGWSNVEALTMLRWAGDRARPAILMSESTQRDTKRVWPVEAVKGHVVKQFQAALVGGQPQEDYVVSLGLGRDRVFRGYNVVDNEFFVNQAAKVREREAGWRRELRLPDQYFLASNRFIEKKNLARLIEAYRIYHAEKGSGAWHLVLLGDGPLGADLEKQVNEAGLADFVHFSGFKQYEDLPTYYALANAFCHVSTVEQWGLVVNEAMASGLPVMVSKNCGCANDLVQEGVNGFVVDPLDIAHIASRLLLMHDSSDLDTMGRQSQKLIAAYHPERFGEGLWSAIQAAGSTPVRRMGFWIELLLRLLSKRRLEFGK